MRFSSLGSGSSGNALVVEAGSTRLLVDCGFSMSEIERRLALIGIAPDTIDAILITHEHKDHYGCAGRLSGRYRIPVCLTAGSRAAVGRAHNPTLKTIDPHDAFAIGDIGVHPYPVPHDAREPCQYVLTDGSHRLGVLTDAGRITPHMYGMLQGCDALLIECNYDPGMLARGPYPPVLRERVSGDYGHLANGQAAEFILSVDRGRLQHVAGMHVSRKNNTADLAAAAIGAALGCCADEITVATQEGGFGWRSLHP